VLGVPAAETEGIVDKLLKVAEVAERTKMSGSWVYARMASGELPPVRLGVRSLRVRERDLERWLAEQAQPATAEREAESANR
jgi:excisionase family DNA binding protein